MPFNREERYDWQVDESFPFGFGEWIRARFHIEDEIMDEVLRPLGLPQNSIIDDDDMDAIRLEMVFVGTVRYLDWKAKSAAGDWAKNFYVSLHEWNLAEEKEFFRIDPTGIASRLTGPINDAYARRNLVRGSVIIPSEDVIDDICTEAIQANKRSYYEFLVAAYRDAVLLDPNWEKEWEFGDGGQSDGRWKGAGRKLK